MAGRGPAPKPPERRARTNKEPVALRIIEARPVGQPDLPPRYKKLDDIIEEVDWPVETVKWWRMWGESPLASDFTDTDWSELLIAAFLHAEFMQGEYKHAGELRLRTAKLGATPEDRLRLRIQFAQAVDAEVTAGQKVVSARDRMQGIRKAGS